MEINNEIIFWLARDVDNDLTLYQDKPYKDDDGYFYPTSDLNYYNIEENLYPEITYENSPVEMRLVPTKK